MGITNTGAGHTGTNQWKQQVAARGNASPKNRRKPQLKPQLIKPMGSISNPPKGTCIFVTITFDTRPICTRLEFVDFFLHEVSAADHCFSLNLACPCLVDLRYVIFSGFLGVMQLANMLSRCSSRSG